MKRAIVSPAPSSDAARFAFLDLLVAIGREVYPYSVYGPHARPQQAASAIDSSVIDDASAA